MDSNFKDAALILIGHGSTVREESAAPVFEQAAELRRRDVFGCVIEAFWKVQPSIRAALEGATKRRVFIVPLFLSNGYFTEQAIPIELGLRKEGDAGFARVQFRGDQTLYYCAPVGTHESITELLLARADDVCQKHPFPRLPRREETALILVGHGTPRNANSRTTVEWQVERLRASGQYCEVHGVFLEESPRVSDCFALTTRRNLVVVPFFISEGLHAAEDIPRMLGEAERVVRERIQKGQPAWRNPTGRNGRLIWCAQSLGTDPRLADLIVERVKEAADSTLPAH